MGSPLVAGALGPEGCADVFQLVASQRKSGMFVVRGLQRAIDLHLHEGRLIRVQEPTRDRRRALGTMLVNARVIPLQTLEHALAQQPTLALPLGALLVQHHGVDAASIHQFLRLQALESLYAALLLTTGTYEFQLNRSTTAAPELAPGVPWELVLMDVAQRLMELPLIQARIPDLFLEVQWRTPVSNRVGATPADGEDSQVLAHRGFPDADDRAVHALVEAGFRTVLDVVDASRLGDFQACRSLWRLAEAGCVAVYRAAESTPVSTQMTATPTISQDLSMVQELLKRTREPG